MEAVAKYKAGEILLYNKKKTRINSTWWDGEDSFRYELEYLRGSGGMTFSVTEGTLDEIYKKRAGRGKGKGNVATS